jgi:hypothetical protein
MKLITNNQPRLLIDAYELTATERTEFDYLDWQAIDQGNDSATFFRYRGRLYDLGEFMRSTDPNLKGWHGYAADSFFSGVVIKLSDDGDYVTVATYLA